MSSLNDAQWSQLSCNQDSLIDRAHDFDWTITWNALKQVQHFKCTSSRRNALWAFMVKILNNTLPVGQILKKWRSRALFHSTQGTYQRIVT
ncbi:hypothetical protein RirG_003040 [Rhizophagus irregularis DAOM 197198w]|uniref:Uncharacterized protein n=1 Tax=Rhizophagus irregularis (strain DAOM 197198w) TaxID=1432141 RepID=A0A015KD70_RHIIW|nr:hypothetical protein RirG_003040 [Rhizophagus irregularis DAOM 197198w]